MVYRGDGLQYVSRLGNYTHKWLQMWQGDNSQQVSCR